MASGRDMLQGKRRHVRTEKMEEFLKAKDDASSPAKKLTCPIQDCNKMFTSTPGLKYHLQTHSSVLPQFSCRKCTKLFKSANGLKYHRERTSCGDFYDAADSPDVEVDDSGGGDNDGGPMQVPSPDKAADQTFTYHFPERRPTLAPPAPVHSGMDKLTELAIIATSPHSPLMQRNRSQWGKMPSAEVVRSLTLMLDSCEGNQRLVIQTDSEPNLDLTNSSETCDNSYSHAVDSTAVVTVSDQKCSDYCLADRNGLKIATEETSDIKVSTDSLSLVSPCKLESPGSWSHTWSTPAWHCFLSGSHVMYGSNNQWQLVDTLSEREDLFRPDDITSSTSCYANEGLVVQSMKALETDNTVHEIKFTSTGFGEPALVARCQKDHPFLVKDKGWTSCEAVEQRRQLCVGDVCLPPSLYDEEKFKSLEEFEFTSEDSSAVFALSSMKSKKDSELSPTVELKPLLSPFSGTPKGKRPMNAFLLFAKEVRVNFTQQFPKRDNREISVMIGEQWKGLSPEKRAMYKETAQRMAHDHKLIHPDCWKRKK